jgi:hypothetical protein
MVAPGGKLCVDVYERSWKTWAHPKYWLRPLTTRLDRGRLFGLLVRQLVESPELRAEKAQMAFERAQRYSWQGCPDETFAFLARIASGTHSHSAHEASSKGTSRLFVCC